MHQPLTIAHKEGIGGVHGQIVHGLGIGDHRDGLNRAKRAVQRDDFRAKKRSASTVLGGLRPFNRSFRTIFKG